MSDKALLLGINKYKRVGSLRGCVNDVNNMNRLLTESFRFDPRNIHKLIDEEVVKSNVMAEMKWLLKDAKPSDRVILHFSGHGSQTADVDGDEADRVDELICLHDMDFGNPNTYLLDDELRKWTQGLPAGVQLTIVFDSCHSGTGTRMLLNPTGSRSAKPKYVMVDVKTSAARATSGGMRGLGVHEVVEAVTRPDSPDAVRLRFVEPPIEIQNAINQRKQSGRRGLVVANMNHVLLAGCKDTQESADAHIENDFHGAFTFHLCKTIRSAGVNIDRKALIERVERSLFDARFSQSPQLEGPAVSGPLFGKSKTTSTPKPKTRPVDDEASEDTPAANLMNAVGVDELLKLLPSIALLAPEAQVEALRLLRASIAADGGPAAEGRQVGGRKLVYVHGICKHEPGYSNGWWNALKGFTGEFGSGDLDDQRREVLWSDLVNARALGMSPEVTGPEAEEQQEAKLSLIDALQDRVDRQNIASSESGRGLDDGLPLIDDETRSLSIPFLNCLDDFTVYMVNSDTRAQIIKRFTDVVRPLLDAGNEIDIIAHSWGTVVAYEGLRELADESTTPGHVRNFITVGAALSLSPVKAALRTANKDGKRPGNVSRWVNINARGDIVGGELKGRPYQVDADFPTVVPVGCSTLFGRAVNPACAHRSYFLADNTAVNRDIFAAFINRA